jgi:hypothetical protein
MPLVLARLRHVVGWRNEVLLVNSCENCWAQMDQMDRCLCLHVYEQRQSVGGSTVTKATNALNARAAVQTFG